MDTAAAMRLRTVLVVLIISSSIAVAACVSATWRTSNERSAQVMTELKTNSRPYCVGRLLINLPEGTTWGGAASNANIAGVPIAVESAMSRDDFDAYVRRRWSEILVAKPKSERYVNRPPQKLSPAPHAVIFTFGHRSIEGAILHGMRETFIHAESEGYLWLNNRMIQFKPTLNSSVEIARLMERIVALGEAGIPNQPGLCLDGIFIAGRYDFKQHETATWIFDLPGRLSLRVDQTRVWKPAQSFANRIEASRLAGHSHMEKVRSSGASAKSHLFRQTERVVHGLSGDELIVGEVEGHVSSGYRTLINALWEHPGRGAENPSPRISISLSTPAYKTKYPSTLPGGFPDATDAPGALTETEFLAVWEGVVSSIQRRAIAMSLPSNEPFPASVITFEQAEANRKALDEFIASSPESGESENSN